MDNVQKIAEQAKAASFKLALASSKEKNQSLQLMADQIRAQHEKILSENAQDIQVAKEKNKPDAIIDRLLLTVARIEAIAASVEAIKALPDPVGKILAEWDRPNGLNIKRVSVPLGVIGVIYEARPNVTADAAALCLKAGNAVILRGGSDSFASCNAIMHAISDALQASKLPDLSVQMIPNTSHESVGELLQLDQYIDVIVPRGGPSLIERISRESKIPLFKHLQGICHTYIHKKADPQMAHDVLINAKLRRPGICGATETVLVDKAIIESHLPAIVKSLLAGECEIRGDENIQPLNAAIKCAQDEDWSTEYLDKIISIKAVENIDEAIEHINHFSSDHTEAIITDDMDAAAQFLNQVQSAIVMHNTSTQFADGGEFGMGAEIGIATGKLHARGPVGVEQLTTFKYHVSGSGQTRP